MWSELFCWPPGSHFSLRLVLHRTAGDCNVEATFPLPWSQRRHAVLCLWSYVRSQWALASSARWQQFRIPTLVSRSVRLHFLRILFRHWQWSGSWTLNTTVRCDWIHFDLQWWSPCRKHTKIEALIYIFQSLCFFCKVTIIANQNVSSRNSQSYSAFMKKGDSPIWNKSANCLFEDTQTNKYLFYTNMKKYFCQESDGHTIQRVFPSRALPALRLAMWLMSWKGAEF